MGRGLRRHDSTHDSCGPGHRSTEDTPGRSVAVRGCINSSVQLHTPELVGQFVRCAKRGPLQSSPIRHAHLQGKYRTNGEQHQKVNGRNGNGNSAVWHEGITGAYIATSNCG